MTQITLDALTWLIPDGWHQTAHTFAHCRSCHAAIAWFERDGTKTRAPFNPDGVSHFATCPQAAQWRKR